MNTRHKIANKSFGRRPAHGVTGGAQRVQELTPCPDVGEAFQLLSGLPHVVLLESSLRHGVLGRYSFLTADPFEWLWSRVDRVFLSDRQLACADPFRELEEQLSRWSIAAVPGLPPFQGGAAGLFGYDLCHHLEQLPRPGTDEFQVPDMAVGFYDWVLAWDHELDRAWLISTGLPEDDSRRRRRAARRMQQVGEWLRHGTGPRQAPVSSHVVPARQEPVSGLRALTSNFSRESYLEAVRTTIEYICAGDCFQVNVAQRLLAPASMTPVELYGRLRKHNPSTFAGYLDLGDYVVVSASPERFLKVVSGDVQTRPIKGTRPRGQTGEEDRQQEQELLASAKDRAENIMIVDLLRNDLGRVCRYGSVRVPAVCRLESYPFVHHLVSEVRGRLRADRGPVDLLRAAFPGGSVTGAPKIRAMEIIAELEPTARGPYCGSLGYIGFDGTMDTSILIRTFTAGGGWFQFPVGGGIVADSIPEREYEETWHKAEGLLRALQ